MRGGSRERRCDNRARVAKIIPAKGSGRLEGARKPARVNGERGRADDDDGPMHLPRGKGSERWFVEKDLQVDVSGLDSPGDYERSQGPMRKA